MKQVERLEKRESVEKRRTHTLAEAAYRELLSDIVHCRLKPGERLHFHDIRRRYGMGLAPLREALSRLAVDGFVVSESFRGFRVAPISTDELEELVALRLNLECQALRRSIERGDVDWEARIAYAYQKMIREPPFDPRTGNTISERASIAHGEFHRALLSACDWPRLLAFCDILWRHAARYRSLAFLYEGRQRDVGKEHKQIMDAALARDADAACRHLSRHITRTAEGVLNSLAKGNR